MALTKVGKEGVVGLDNSADATAITIDSSERVMIGTTTEGDASADDLTVAGSANTGITIRAGTSNSSSIYMSDATSGTGEYAGYIAYSHNTNSMTFGTSSAASLSIDTNGIITKPRQPSFLARPNGAQSNIAEGSIQDIAMGTEVFDRGADFASSTFTAPLEGLYFLSFCLYTNTMDTAPAYVESQLTTSNRVYRDTIDPRGFDQDLSYFCFKLAVLADMDAGDTAKVQLLIHDLGTVQQDVTGDSFFSGYLVC